MKTNHALLAAALVFAAGTTIYFQSAQGHSNKPFVVTFSRYRKSTPEKSHTMIQLVNSQGRSLIKRLSSDGREIEHFLPAFAPGHWQAWSDRAAYLRSAYVTRTEQIRGYTAYVFKQDVGGQMLERWYAPETGPVPLKEIVELENGDALVTEAINIEFREVSDKEIEPQTSLIY